MAWDDRLVRPARDIPGHTYNGRPLALAGLASQKRYISLYLNSVHGDRATEAWFRERTPRPEEARHGEELFAVHAGRRHPARPHRRDDRPRQPGQFPGALQNGPRLVAKGPARGLESPGHGRGADAFDAPNGVRTCLLAPLPSSAKFRQFLRRQIERRHSAGGSARRNPHCSSIELRSATPSAGLPDDPVMAACSACPDPVPPPPRHLECGRPQTVAHLKRARTTLSVHRTAPGGRERAKGSAADQRGSQRPVHPAAFTNLPMPILEPERRRRRQNRAPPHFWLLALGLAVAIAVQAVLR